jgi:uncharacterized membrane protein
VDLAAVAVDRPAAAARVGVGNLKRKEVPKLFFTEEEKERIARCIEEAEKKTSAEIVVRIEKNCPGDPIERCRALLPELGLTATAERSAVIILISLQDHKAAVFGDEAVDKMIGYEGWKQIIQDLVTGFREDRPCEALCAAIDKLADSLSECFPCKAGDINELPNAVSVSDEQ